MIIMDQYKTSLYIMESLEEVSVAPAIGGEYNGGYFINALAPWGPTLIHTLGVYKSKNRAIEVLEEIAKMCENVEKIEGRVHPEFGYVNCNIISTQKLYRMPDE